MTHMHANVIFFVVKSRNNYAKFAVIFFETKRSFWMRNPFVAQLKHVDNSKDFGQCPVTLFPEMMSRSSGACNDFLSLLVSFSLQLYVSDGKSCYLIVIGRKASLLLESCEAQPLLKVNYWICLQCELIYVTNHLSNFGLFFIIQAQSIQSVDAKQLLFQSNKQNKLYN